MTRNQPRSSEDSLLTIAIPAKDEAETIEETLETLPIGTLEMLDLEVEVCVLDGDSRDRTAEMARDWGATVLPDDGQGKGVALREARDELAGDLVVMLDADGTYAADAIPRVLRPLRRGEADVVMGRRQPRPGAMKPSHRVGNALLSLEASVLYAKHCPDVCTGLWGFRGELLRGLPLRSTGFELEAELFALAARMELDIERVPVDYLPRAGETKLEGRRDGWRIAWWLLRSRFAALPEASASRRPAALTPRQGGAR